MNLSCSNQDPCPVILDSKCVIYEGENLLYIGVNTNDNLRFALEQINSVIGNLVLTGGITELIGDVSAYGPGVATATLATVNSTPGQYGSSTAIPKITVDGKGRITAITTDPVFIPSGALDFFGDVSGSGTTGTPVQLTLATVNSNVYGSNSFLKFAVNGKGLVTSATPVVSSDITTALGYTPAPSGNYITDLNGEVSGSGPGVANVTLNNNAVTGKVLTGVNITGGSIVDTDSILTAFGKLQNQINSLIGGSIYQGTWNAATNVPFLQSGVGIKGHYYITDVYGTTNLDGINEWHVGDWAIFDGTEWQKVDNTDAVISVNGQTGAVSLTTDNIPEGATNRYFTTSRARLALSGGTGISYDNVTGVITNSAPDQTVSLSSGAGINVTGTYPNFTIASTITQYTDALARQAISLTTTGTSGPATYNSTTGVLNIPQYQGGVTSFNIRTGAVTLISGDVTGALGYTPADDSLVVKLAGTQTISGQKSFTSDILESNTLALSETGTLGSWSGYTNIAGATNGLRFKGGGGLTAGFNFTSLGVVFTSHGGYSATINYGVSTNRTYTLPYYDGTLALTSDIPSLAGYVPTSRTLTINGTSYDLSADRSWTIATGGVSSFNTRTGAITLTSSDVTSALGYTPVSSKGQSNWNDGTVINNVVGMLVWKNYGNGHVIFDASQSTSPSGTSVNNTNAAVAWTASYPTLMGWNGSNTYGVRVDSARVADSASSVTNGVYTNASMNSLSGVLNFGANNATPYANPTGLSNGISFGGIEGNLRMYGIFTEQENVGGNYSKLTLNYHTGIRLGAYFGYGGTRFYNNSVGGGGAEIFSVGNGDSNIRASNDIIAYASDRRLKHNIQPIENALLKVISLTGMTYQWNNVGSQHGWEPDTEIREAGVFAQDVQAVLPEAVKLAPFDNNMGVSKSGKNFLTVKYEKIVPLLIEAIKEQQTQIEELKSIINGFTK